METVLQDEEIHVEIPIHDNASTSSSSTQEINSIASDPIGVNFGENFQKIENNETKSTSDNQIFIESLNEATQSIPPQHQTQVHQETQSSLPQSLHYQQATQSQYYQSNVRSQIPSGQPTLQQQLPNTSTNHSKTIQQIADTLKILSESRKKHKHLADLDPSPALGSYYSMPSGNINPPTSFPSKYQSSFASYQPYNHMQHHELSFHNYQKPSHPSGPPLPPRHHIHGENVPYAVALYDFEAGDPSELSFVEGDRIIVLEQEDGWWRGELNGKQGLFPSNYVKLCKPVPPPKTADLHHTKKESSKASISIQTVPQFPSIANNVKQKEKEVKSKKLKKAPKKVDSDDEEEETENRVSAPTPSNWVSARENEDKFAFPSSTAPPTLLQKRGKDRDVVEDTEITEDTEDDKKEIAVNIGSADDDSEEGSRYEWPTLLFLVVILVVLYFWDIF